jgi:hypothetical protein
MGSRIALGYGAFARLNVHPEESIQEFRRFLYLADTNPCVAEPEFHVQSTSSMTFEIN